MTNLDPHDVLFIDEIHRLSPVVEEILYPALEDYRLDIMIGEGPAARSVKIDLPPFTLVGATTRAGMLTNPLRDRFGIVSRLEFYENRDLTTIVSRSAQLLQLDMGEEGAMEVAKRSRGTPRIANRLLRRVRDFADVKNNGVIDAAVADAALSMLDVDAQGLDVMDRKFLEAVLHKFGGGPCRFGQRCRRHRRIYGHHRRRYRTLPHPTRLFATHPARQDGDRTRLPAFRAARRKINHAV